MWACNYFVCKTTLRFKSNRISNTNSTNGGPSYVRVYDSANNLVSEQAINKRNPLGYIRSVVNSKHKRDLYAQCVPVAMSRDEFVAEFGEVKLIGATTK